MLALLSEAWMLHARGRRWEEHFVDGMLGLLHARFGAMGVAAHWDLRGRIEPVVPSFVGRGSLDAAQRDAIVRWLRERGWRFDGVNDSLAARSSVSTTVQRRELIDDSTWQRFDYMHEHFRIMDVGDPLLSCTVVAPDRAHQTNFQRERGERPFDERERAIVEMMHEAIMPLVARGPWAAGSPADALPPRMREVLDGLLRGQSMKQIARAMGVSVHTVHTYVKELHRRFQVSSRGELLAKCLGHGQALAGPSLGRGLESGG